MENILEIYSGTENCPIRTVLDRFGDKWSMLVLLILDHEKKVRFNQIHKTIGDVSQKMLTVTLRKLEADGLVERTVFPEIPPRVEYNLTPRGQSLIPHVQNLSQWAKDNIGEIRASRANYSK
ncbi:winged helix-turn-helix transcriptional regulator [Algoriphagus vanfongensis]|uniref:winged helix-turn-helix transcriptional regulator n=1 Tax=Algoriphagus vanfongensis TaxID=426371 RepID=UPI00040A7C75|nr:helix-turn-helix domain-containing protein [Algoriphagus vanfongensis]